MSPNAAGNELADALGRKQAEAAGAGSERPAAVGAAEAASAAEAAVGATAAAAPERGPAPPLSTAPAVLAVDFSRKVDPLLTVQVGGGAVVAQRFFGESQARAVRRACAAASLGEPDCARVAQAFSCLVARGAASPEAEDPRCGALLDGAAGEAQRGDPPAWRRRAGQLFSLVVAVALVALQQQYAREEARRADRDR
ncbi:hypothetical protein M885DRAFT_536372 [Pelagophyceae sp. CCMP2097]|nr:hypothetical protein M885DRAFT_536372 [Pelagophyceae sp. CCMP2097]